MTCFHCSNHKRCDCISCGVASHRGWAPGPCVVCRGAAFNHAYRHIIDAHEPRTSANWRRVPAADGNKAYLVYLPLEGLHR